MGIKWDDVKIRAGAFSGEIYLGKMKKNSNLEVFVDKSEPKTKECVKAVMEHMLMKCEEQKAEEVSFTVNGICKLTITDLRKKG